MNASPHPTSSRSQAIFGGGCFWCLDAVFARLQGVSKVTCGYSGGLLPEPDYAAVCTGCTGHAEVVCIDFDPAQISYTELLQVFFAIHDPTTADRQGNDHGTQYRSIILCTDARQAASAQQVLERLTADGAFGTAQPVTQIVPASSAGVFYPAEAEHQSYFARHPLQPYCNITIPPKLAKLEQHFAHLLAT